MLDFDKFCWCPRELDKELEHFVVILIVGEKKAKAFPYYDIW